MPRSHSNVTKISLTDPLYNTVVPIQTIPTLRDQFAMAALTGCLSRSSLIPTQAQYDYFERFAIAAYEIADYMLKHSGHNTEGLNYNEREEPCPLTSEQPTQEN